MPTRSKAPLRPHDHAPSRRAARSTPPPNKQRPLLFNFDPTLTRTEREQRRTQWVVLLTIVVFSVAVIVGLVGYYVNGIRQPGLPVATVNGHNIRRDTWQHYQALLSAELQGQAVQIQSSPATDPAAQAKQQAQLQQLQQEQGGIPDQAVNDLINAQIVTDAIPNLEKQGAPADKLVPTSKQVDDALATEKQTLGVTTPADFQQALKGMNLSESDLRAILTTRLEEDNVKAYLSRDLQATQPQVKARTMTFGDSAKASAALKALRGGQNWADVNLQYSKDSAAKETSQDIDWTPKGLQSQAFDQFAFSAKPFQISDVLNDNGQFTIVQVEDVAPARPLSSDQISQLQTKTYSDWLTQQTDQAHVQRFPQNMGS